MREQTILYNTYSVIILSDNQVLHLHSHYPIWGNRHSGVTPTKSLSYIREQSGITIRAYTYAVIIIYEGTILDLHSQILYVRLDNMC